MGMPGTVTVKITTTFDREARSASRTVQYIEGYGLNDLAASSIGQSEYWDEVRDIVSDTIDLPDGVHVLEIRSCRHRPDYKWLPVEN